jgi:hypothetical protein
MKYVLQKTDHRVQLFNMGEEKGGHISRIERDAYFLTVGEQENKSYPVKHLRHSHIFNRSLCERKWRVGGVGYPGAFIPRL